MDCLACQPCCRGPLRPGHWPRANPAPPSGPHSPNHGISLGHRHVLRLLQQLRNCHRRALPLASWIVCVHDYHGFAGAHQRHPTQHSLPQGEHDWQLYRDRNRIRFCCRSSRPQHPPTACFRSRLGCFRSSPRSRGRRRDLSVAVSRWEGPCLAILWWPKPLPHARWRATQPRFTAGWDRDPWTACLAPGRAEGPWFHAPFWLLATSREP